MAKQTINIGSSANKGDGDPLRTAFDKINDNFTELYARAENTDSQTLTLTGNTLSISGGNSVTLNISPTGDLKGSVFADDSTLLVDAVNGVIPYSVLSGTPTIPTDISDLTDNTNLLSSGGADTGDVTFSGVKIIGAGTASGDGNGYSTLELVPDNNLYENDQYLVIDPTSPTHIHIRAGGTQDSSNAELFLGGENNHVRVTDFGGVELQNQIVTTPSYFYSDGTDFTNGTWYENSGAYYIQYTSTNAELDSKAFENIESITAEYSGGFENLTYAGSASNLGGGVYRVQVNEAPPASPTALTTIEYYIFLTRTNRVTLENNDFTVSVTDDIRITGNDIFSLRNTGPNSSIEIRTDYDGVDRVWEFGANGTLTTPGDIIVSGDITGTGGASTLILKAQPNSGTAIQLNNIVDSTISTVANLEIRTDVSNTAKTWTFDSNGTLTVPGTITSSDGFLYLGYDFSATPDVYIGAAGGGKVIRLESDRLQVFANPPTTSKGISGDNT